MNNIEAFKSEALLIKDQFPELIYQEKDDGKPFLSGSLILKDDQGTAIDEYLIKIEYTSGYPFEFPHVYETGGRIPINIDWHVFLDGHCCIASIPEESLLCKKGITLYWFIEHQVKPYFFNQKYREIHGYFLHERSHGLEGNLEFFREAFGTDRLSIIAKGLVLIKSRREPNRVSICYCGTGIKYRKCHREAFRKFSALSDEELDFFVKMVTSSTKFTINS